MHFNILLPLTTKLPCLMAKYLLKISPAYFGQLVIILITLEPYGIFGSNFVYLFVPGTCIQNHEESLSRDILVIRDLSVKILITFEPHGIF